MAGKGFYLETLTRSTDRKELIAGKKNWSTKSSEKRNKTQAKRDEGHLTQY